MGIDELGQPLWGRWATGTIEGARPGENLGVLQSGIMLPGDSIPLESCGFPRHTETTGLWPGVPAGSKESVVAAHGMSSAMELVCTICLGLCRLRWVDF